MKLFLFFSLPLFLFFCISLQQGLCKAGTLGNETDKLALIAFKNGITDDPLQILNSWNDSLSFCEWGGVTCSSRRQRVIMLDLDSHGLKGSVSPFIGNLSFLTTVSLRNNSLHGTIPQEIGRLFRLQYLRMNNNSFSGHIPLNLSHCSSLVFLSLGRNNFEGNIPVELGSLSRLVNLSLSNNNLNGLIPASLGNLSSLENFYLNDNSLEGSIPDSFGQLKSVIRLYLGDNLLAGMIPSSLYNLSSLEEIYLANNQLEGSLPHDIGDNLQNLRNFMVSNNSFSGSIPVSLFKNVSVLEIVDLGFNKFTGKFPTEVGSQGDLVALQLAVNNLGTGKDDLDFITSLTNCSKLSFLDIGANRFQDALPLSVANLSDTLISLYFGENQIFGTIPPHIGNLVSLTILSAELNLLTGSIPEGVGGLQNLQSLTLNGNKFSGRIPYFTGNYSKLVNLDLSNNFLEGKILPSIENCQFLQILNLSYNNLSGTIPKEVVGVTRQLRLVILARNSLTGPLPLEVGNLEALQLLDVSENKLTGEIPSTLGSCLSLEYVYLQNNLLQGSIPSSFGSLKGIQELNLSRNNLSGEIPRDLEDLSLTSLDLAFNNFEGDVPRKGIFQNETAFSIVGNDKLCGGIPELHLLNCYTRKSKREGLPLIWKVILGILVPSLVVLVIALYWKKKPKRELPSTRFPKSGLTRVSYNDLHKATNGFSSENLIGTGSYGTVYKGMLHQDQGPIAVKVLSLTEQGGYKSFMAECEILREVRHRNLLKILTVCSSQDFKSNDFKALVFEFMPNGSLEDWIHPSSDVSKSLNLHQRLNIAIDIASALDYLHNFSETPIVHCDLKPSNVLLDDDMVAYVCDFGLAKFLPKTNSGFTSEGKDSVAVRGTIGYIPPEYGIGDKVSKQGDMYSYGILLLEMFTGKRPTDKMFEDGLSLHTLCEVNITGHVMDIVDLRILSEEIPNEASSDKEEQNLASTQERECLASIIRIGVQCSSESIGERMEIKDVLTELHAITRNLLHGINEHIENADS